MFLPPYSHDATLWNFTRGYKMLQTFSFFLFFFNSPSWNWLLVWKNKSAERPLLPSGSALSLDSPPCPPHPDIRRPFAPTDCGEGRHPANPDSGLDKPPAVSRFSATEPERERTSWSLRVWQTPALPLISHTHTHTHRRVGGEGVGGWVKDVIPLTERGLPPPARGWTPESRALRSGRLSCEELSISTFVCRGSEWISFYSSNVSVFVVALEAAEVDDVVTVFLMWSEVDAMDGIHL